MFDDIDSVYNSLNWKSDIRIVNSDGDYVWLKELYVNDKYEPIDDKNGKRIGITDCCFVSNPCKKHKKMQKIENIAMLN